MLRSKVISTFDVVGFHCWPEPLEEVGYLGNKHRHIFKFRLEAAVEHDNRAVEFHMLARAAKALLASMNVLNEHGEYEFGGRSCEMLARELMEALRQQHWPLLAVEVWEDSEHGGRVEQA